MHGVNSSFPVQEYDDPSARKSARTCLLFGTLSLTFAAIIYFQPVLLRRPPDLIESGGFASLLAIAGILLATLAAVLWFTRYRLRITPSGVEHLPASLYGSRDFSWRDVESWGYESAREPTETGKEDYYLVWHLFVTLNSGKTIVSPGFEHERVVAQLQARFGDGVGHKNVR